jgi:hypothetical protein
MKSNAHCFQKFISARSQNVLASTAGVPGELVPSPGLDCIGYSLF